MVVQNNKCLSTAIHISEGLRCSRWFRTWHPEEEAVEGSVHPVDHTTPAPQSLPCLETVRHDIQDLVLYHCNRKKRQPDELLHLGGSSLLFVPPEM